MKESWQVAPCEGGCKLIAFLKIKTGEKFSSRQLKSLLENNSCTVNGRIERFGSVCIVTGDQICLVTENIPTPLLEPIVILLKDKDFIIINKPSGISSEDPLLKKRLEPSFGELTLMHRLDKATSGALLFARNEEIAKAIVLLFRERKIEKKYLAIVDGVPKKPKGRIENFLGKIRGYQGQSIWGAVLKDEGLQAITTWEVEERFSESCLLKCFPLTGRTHQIRVHLSSIGHPILGDVQYGKHFTCKYQANRTLLHASMIAFSHPKTHKKISVIAPEPKDFTLAVKTLKGVQ